MNRRHLIKKVLNEHLTLLKEEDIGMTWPVDREGRVITDTYGSERDGGKREHKGIDLRARCGENILSPLSGTVEISRRGSSACYGEVMINHGEINGNTYKTRFCHVGRRTFEAGDKVNKGDKIGVSTPYGSTSTACHCHLEVYKNGKVVDPYPFLESLNPQFKDKSKEVESDDDNFFDDAKEKVTDYITTGKEKIEDLVGNETKFINKLLTAIMGISFTKSIEERIKEYMEERGYPNHSGELDDDVKNELKKDIDELPASKLLFLGAFG